MLEFSPSNDQNAPGVVRVCVSVRRLRSTGPAAFLRVPSHSLCMVFVRVCLGVCLCVCGFGCVHMGMWRPEVKFGPHLIFKIFVFIMTIILNFRILIVYVHTSETSVDARREHTALLDPLELEWVLGTELWSFGRAASTLHH